MSRALAIIESWLEVIRKGEFGRNGWMMTKAAIDIGFVCGFCDGKGYQKALDATSKVLKAVTEGKLWDDDEYGLKGFKNDLEYLQILLKQKALR